MKRGTVLISQRPGLPPMWRASVGLRERPPRLTAGERAWLAAWWLACVVALALDWLHDLRRGRK